MQFTVNTRALDKELALVQRAVSAKPSIPVLSCVRITASLGKVELVASDLDVTLASSVDASIDQIGSCAIPARTLKDIVSAISADETTLRVDGKGVQITAGAYRGRLQTFSIDDYPVIAEPPANGTEIPASILRDLIARVRYAVTAEDSRYFLQGALMEIATNGRIAMSSTDGHRLSYASTSFAGPDGKPADVAATRAIVPRLGLFALYDLLDVEGSATFVASENQLFFVTGSRRLTTRVVDGKFPDVDRVIPKAHPSSFVCERESLAGAVRRVLLTSSNSNSVSFAFSKDGVDVRSLAADVGEGNEWVGGTGDGPNGAIKVAMNGRYVLNVLDTVTSPKIRIGMKDEANPVRMDQDGGSVDHCSVVMPMRV
jgi:DNA polymerase-3 subunit beta